MLMLSLKRSPAQAGRVPATPTNNNQSQLLIRHLKTLAKLE
jgi:hypothetical protein